MSYSNNLIPFSERSKEEVRESAARGGRKSGETRRRKRDMKQRLRILLDLPCSNADDRDVASAMGLEPEEVDNETIMLIGLFLEAKSGNVSAIREIRNILGEDNSSEELALKKKELNLKEKAMTETQKETAVQIVDDI